jgi:hypothetical protein
LGYVRERRNYKLVFTDDEFDGLEVVARSASVATYERIAGLATREYGSVPTADDLEEIAALLEAFAAVLVSWNLEEPTGKGDKVRPVPATLAGLKAQDLPFVQAIILAWMNAVAGVSVPLDDASSSGEMEASLPMDVLAPSP